MARDALAAIDGGDRARTALLHAQLATALQSSRPARRGRSLLARLDPRHRLSMRELQIARYVAGGTSNRQIATLLGLSERTVDTHVQNILAKLDVHSRVQIAGWAADSAPRRRGWSSSSRTPGCPSNCSSPMATSSPPWS